MRWLFMLANWVYNSIGPCQQNYFVVFSWSPPQMKALVITIYRKPKNADKFVQCKIVYTLQYKLVKGSMQ